MRFRFDANQEFQLAAIDAVTDLFRGQGRLMGGIEFLASDNMQIATAPNRLDLDDAALLGNLREVQKRNGIRPDAALESIEESIKTATEEKACRFSNFSVEMETGTGKTYVYLRTLLELNRRYGMRKFIIVVPSVAVREGVLKTLRVTEDHFKALFGNPVYRYCIYDSSNLTQVRQFALADAVEVMVVTIQSFNKAANVIRQTTDRLQGETPIHLVQAARTDPAWATFADLPHGRGYDPVHRGRVLGRLCATAGRDRATFVEACRGLGAEEIDLGEAGFCFQVFPRLAVAIAWYAGDDEFPPNASFLYPKNVLSFLPVEDAVVLAECVISRLQGKPW